MSRVLHRQRIKGIYGDDVYRKHNPSGFDSNGRQRKTTRPPRATSGSPSNVLTSPIQSLAYQPDPTITQTGKASFLKRMRTSSPNLAQKMEAAMQQHDFFTLYQSSMAPYGIELNNPAHTFAAYKILSWKIVNQQTQNPSVEEVQAVSRQMEQILKTSPLMANTLNRQLLDEELKYNYVVFLSGYQAELSQGGRNLAQLENSVNQLWKAKFGQDLRQIKLTSQGFSKL